MHTLEQHVPAQAAVIWVDTWHALIARTDHGRPTVTEVDRVAESEHDYFQRVAREAEDCDRLMLLGPATTWQAFELEYCTVFRRVDRFVEAETAAPTTPRELVERLRLLEPDERRA
ncbi:MAG TPA: hypothetical protein VL749_08985 [Patescibacteria group bacterium]|nr:hypothetical protein [Patescibacteria group bacterium]